MAERRRTTRPRTKILCTGYSCIFVSISWFFDLFCMFLFNFIFFWHSSLRFEECFPAIVTKSAHIDNGHLYFYFWVVCLKLWLNYYTFFLVLFMIIISYIVLQGSDGQFPVFRGIVIQLAKLRGGSIKIDPEAIRSGAFVVMSNENKSLKMQIFMLPKC